MRVALAFVALLLPGLAWWLWFGDRRKDGAQALAEFLGMRHRLDAAGIDGLHLLVPYSGAQRAPYVAKRGNLAIAENRLRPIGNTVYVMPPYVLGDEESAFLAQKTSEALEAALK